MSALAQTPPTARRLTGKVLEESTHRPIPYATVTILRQSVSADSLVRGGLTDEKGQFDFNNLPTEPLRIKVSAIGFQTQAQAVGLATGDVGVIRLAVSANLLKEITVTAAKSDGALSTEKRTFNVAQSLTSAGGTAESLLRNVPSVVIDADGTAKLRNATATIYIDGKPTPMTLAQIPANQIETVEVITNPSAKYEASATGGIINLVLRKNREAGYNGSVSLGIGNDNRYDGALNLDLNEGKWNVTAMYNFNATQNPLNNWAHRTNYTTDRTISGYYNQATHIALHNDFNNARVMVEYAVDKRNTVSLSGNLATGAYNSNTYQQFNTSDAGHADIDQGQRTTNPHNDYTNFGVEAGWKHQFAQKGRALTFTLNFNRNNLSNAADWSTTATLANGSPEPGYPERDLISGHTTGNQYIAQLDYTLPVRDSAKWEMGLRSYTYVRHQRYYFSKLDDASGQYNLLPTFSQDADITETINAAYGQYTLKMKHRYTLEAGLRLEQSSLNGVSHLDGSGSFGYNYPAASGQHWLQAFFPSARLARDINETTNWSFGISRKVGRPGFRQLFVGIQANDRNNVTIGNPKIQPEFVNTAELNFDKKWANVHWLSSLYYILEDHTIKPLITKSPTDSSVFITSFFNAQLDLRGGFDNSVILSLGKHFTVLAGFNFFNTVLQSAEYRTERWCYNAKLNLTYHFPANITAQINVNNDSRFPQLQGYRSAVSAADFAIRKSFLHNRASIAFTVNDLFDSRKFINIYDQPATYQESLNRREVRFYKLTLQLPLGKANANLSKKKEARMIKPDVDFTQ
jgi:outer membrane receptor protein involved in Fe transport